MQDTKAQAMEGALKRTDELLDSFMDVLKQSFGSEHEVRDFSQTVEKLCPKEEPKKEEHKPEKIKEKEDERLHMSLGALIKDAEGCTRCKLCETRHSVVFGTGCAQRPILMVIGEAPGETEDESGLPFVGKAGQFLDKWLSAISLSRDQNVYITNTVKCRPPQNRDPESCEKEACMNYLKQQVNLIQPRAILCLGKNASALMTGREDASMDTLHGRFFFYEGLPLICTYHPATVLRDMDLKRPVWEDLKKLARYLGLEKGGSR